MNKFRQHVPSFVTLDAPPPDVAFETTAELLEIRAVQQFKELMPGFDHFAKCDNMLMAICDSGTRWWVIGYIEDPAAVDLPEWEAPQ